VGCTAPTFEASAGAKRLKSKDVSIGNRAKAREIFWYGLAIYRVFRDYILFRELNRRPRHEVFGPIVA
jgi:hypothetical protein